MNWWTHRIASSQRYCSGLIEVQTLWSMDDVMDAIEILDMYDVLDSESNGDPGDELIRG